MEILRERAWIVLLALVLCTGGAAAYLVAAEPEYEAQADLLITPIPPDDTLLRSLGLIPESVDPTLDVETAAQLIDTREVAEATAQQVDTADGADDVLAAVDVQPVAESNIVAVTAASSTAAGARDLADAFADQAVESRTQTLHEQIDDVLPGIEAQLGDVPEGDVAAELASEIARLQALSSESDPTIRFVTPAATPNSPVAPRPVLVIVAGVLIGVLLGVLAAVASRVLDPTLRREDQLRDLFDVPILARVPRAPGSQEGARGPEGLSLAAREAYRTLRGTLAASSSSGEPPRSLLVTGASPSEGKTTTTINLAASLALAGQKVIVIEADLRRPAIGRAVGIKVDRGLASVLTEQETLEDALVSTAALGPSLRMLLADDFSQGAVDLLSLPSAQRLLRTAQGSADVVLIDSPPLTDVIDAIAFARSVEAVLLVTRLGRTRIAKLRQLGELLAGAAIRPAGFAVLGGAPRGDSAYYYMADDAGRKVREGATPS